MLGAIAGALLVVLPSSSALAGEVTAAGDNLRTGWYPDEPALAPSQLNAEEGFARVFTDELKGQIYAQPLVANGTVLVVTEENWAYGLDPLTGAVRWEKSFGTAVEAGEEGSSATIKCPDLAPRVGITGTPVIDTEHNAAYFVANRYISGSSGPIGWYMHAIDLSSGAELAHFPVQITGEAQNLPSAKVHFEALQQLQRPALLMMGGVVYAAFGSHCDTSPYEGWIVGVSASSGQMTTRWATSAHGASIWQAGSGLVSDGPGQIIFASGNSDGEPGVWDPPVGPGTQNPPPEGKLGESVVRAEVQPTGELVTKDFFTPFNAKYLDEQDFDLGSSGPVAFPSQYFGNHHLLIQSGKVGTVYLLNRDSLGGRGATSNTVLQELPIGHYEGTGPFQGQWGAAGVWPGERDVYLATNHLHFFKYSEPSGKPTLSEAAHTPDETGFGSGSPIITSNSTTAGSAILWLTWCPATLGCPKGELRAYDPASSGEAQPIWKEKIGWATKFSHPGAGDGHIYVANHEGHLLGFAAPSLTPSGESLELTTALGTEVTRVVTFTNTGTTLKVSSVIAPAAPFSAVGLPAPGTVLKPGEAINVSVTFKPSSRAAVNGELGIVSKAGETRVALSGLGGESAGEKAEREQHEREQRAGEAREKATLVSVLGSPAAGEPLLRLTKLQIRAHASSLHSRRPKLAISYTLSANGTVQVVIYRLLFSHACAKGLRSCEHWVSARRLKLKGHAGRNLLTLKIDALPRGSYRLAARPFNASGAGGVAQHVDFRDFRAPH
jgi:hypothetical protein